MTAVGGVGKRANDPPAIVRYKPAEPPSPGPCMNDAISTPSALEQRLRAAQSLLETTDHPIDQVAQESGFGNAAALRAHFRRRLRTTPRAYRRTFTSQAV